MSVRIYISKEDIKNGEIGNARRCPVANAIKRRTTCTDIVVGLNKRLYLNCESYFHTGDSFVRAFDRGQPVEPFKITIIGLDKLP